eukprot:CAMPEP_0194049494 /NCGR_PEP_ID=MMETSP0009_2-20130614/30708_1 /TAXON_ID=210454 /ORGANISM="Grammatophora oceanica, Strain CCMP 410" /LENGTH=274 /DNA_ID=CAMNT_0038695661 /DNA_START=64 /DNA_END=888 /DNA_ORIENTATION=+
MLMNYHEMTMGEARDSPQRRKQFLVICTVIASMFVYHVIAAGGLTPMEIKEGVFPGGEFVYKYIQRDYAASHALTESIGKDLEINSKNFSGLMYSLYLDNPGFNGGPRQRLAGGILVDKKGMVMRDALMNTKNEEIRAKPEPKEDDELTASQRWAYLEYKSVTLPSLDAAVLEFPYTSGFLSALITSYKVIPAMREYAMKKGEPGNVPIVITTCDFWEQYCRHYAPLLQGKDFLLGQPNSEEWLESLGPEPMIDFEKMKKSVKRYTPLGYFFDE